MEQSTQALLVGASDVRRGLLVLRIAAAASFALLAGYFAWLLVMEAWAPPVYLVSFVPFAYGSYRLVGASGADIRSRLSLAIAGGILTILFSMFWIATYAWEYVPGGGGLLVLALDALQLLLIAAAAAAYHHLEHAPGARHKLIVGLVLAIAYCTPFVVYSGTIVGAGGHGARRRTNEPGALRTLRQIHQAEAGYAAMYGRFTEGLNRLGPPATQAAAAEPPTAEHADLVDPVLAGLTAGGANTAFTKLGYRFTYTPGPVGSDGRITAYSISARPLQYKDSGRRSFFVDQSGVIRGTSEDRPVTIADAPVQ